VEKKTGKKRKKKRKTATPNSSGLVATMQRYICKACPMS
jgi:hypothetical protein